MQTEIRPGVGVGEVRLGMHRNDAVKEMALIAKKQPFLKKTLPFNQELYSDHYYYHGDGDNITVSYDQHMNVAIIMVGCDFEGMLLGRSLKLISPKFIMDSFRQKGMSFANDGGMKICDADGIGFFAEGSEVVSIHVFNPRGYNSLKEMYAYRPSK